MTIFSHIWTARRGQHRIRVFYLMADDDSEMPVAEVAEGNTDETAESGTGPEADVESTGGDGDAEDAGDEPHADEPPPDEALEQEGDAEPAASVVSAPNPPSVAPSAPPAQPNPSAAPSTIAAPSEVNAQPPAMSSIRITPPASVTGSARGGGEIDVVAIKPPSAYERRAAAAAAEAAAREAAREEQYACFPPALQGLLDALATPSMRRAPQPRRTCPMPTSSRPFGASPLCVGASGGPELENAAPASPMRFGEQEDDELARSPRARARARSGRAGGCRGAVWNEGCGRGAPLSPLNAHGGGREHAPAVYSHKHAAAWLAGEVAGKRSYRTNVQLEDAAFSKQLRGQELPPCTQQVLSTLRKTAMQVVADVEGLQRAEADRVYRSPRSLSAMQEGLFKRTTTSTGKSVSRLGRARERLEAAERRVQQQQQVVAEYSRGCGRPDDANARCTHWRRVGLLRQSAANSKAGLPPPPFGPWDEEMDPLHGVTPDDIRAIAEGVGGAGGMALQIVAAAAASQRLA